MRTLLMALIMCMAVSISYASDISKEQLKDDASKLSYMMGLDIGTSLKNVPSKIDMKVFTAGVEDGYTENDALFTPKEVAAFKQQYFMKMQSEAGNKNLEEGKNFLETNKKNKGVKTTASGLQYEVLKKGTGAKPKKSDTVTVHYKGTLIDGTEFDSSYKRGEPTSFPLGGVIKGWTEGLQLMKEGAKYRFFIPSDLAYGAKGAGGHIGPNATLIFEVELVSIKK